MTEADPNEVIFTDIRMGRTEGGQAVIIGFALPNGLSGTVGWEFDDDDKKFMQELCDRLEPKLKEKLAGNQGFTPNSAMPFEADRK